MIVNHHDPHTLASCFPVLRLWRQYMIQSKRFPLPILYPPYPDHCPTNGRSPAVGSWPSGSCPATALQLTINDWLKLLPWRHQDGKQRDCVLSRGHRRRAVWLWRKQQVQQGGYSKKNIKNSQQIYGHQNCLAAQTSTSSTDQIRDPELIPPN